MAIGSILLILALLLMAALFVARPLLNADAASFPDEAERSAWLAERERILEALLELDFDQQMGKVPEEIYALQRQQLLGEGAKILQKLDTPAGDEGTNFVEDDRLEALIAAHKAGRRT